MAWVMLLRCSLLHVCMWRSRSISRISMAYGTHGASQDQLEQVFQLANARRARALSQSMQPPEMTPAKVSNKRAQKSTPVSMTPTPTPGQKHFKGRQSPATDALKKLSFGEESSSTEAPPGPNHLKGCLIKCSPIPHTCTTQTR